MACTRLYTFSLQAFVAIEYQAFNLLSTIHNTSSLPGVYYLSQNLGTLLNSSGLVIALPVANIASSFLCSSSLYSKGSLRVKMGIGCVLLLLSSLGLFCVVRIHYHSPALLVSLLLLLLPGFFLLLSEMFGIVTCKVMLCHVRDLPPNLQQGVGFEICINIGGGQK